MALGLFWTKQAIKGYDSIVQYLTENWTEKEVNNFLNESNEFFQLLVEYPEILQKTKYHKNLHRGP